MMALLLIMLTPIQKAHAQAGSASELISTVNALRQSQGLAPYTVDSFLMGFAQSHSDYMASIGAWTHTRSDGTTASAQGIKENVAMGSQMSVSYCVYTVWSDWVHWETMVGFADGSVGAGVAVVGGQVYYTLNVLPSGSVYEETGRDTSQAAVLLQQDTPVPFSQLIVATPDEDGIIIHVVQYGEALWSIAIAYDVKIEQILKNSNLSPSTTEVFEGQRLIIQAATEPTATPTSTATSDPGTPTPTQPRPTGTRFPTRTPAPTHAPTKPPSIIQRALGNGKYLGLGLILLSGLGLIVVIYLGFLKKS